MDGRPDNECFWISHKISGPLTPLTSLGGVHPQCLLKMQSETDWSNSSQFANLRRGNRQKSKQQDNCHPSNHQRLQEKAKLLLKEDRHILGSRIKDQTWTVSHQTEKEIKWTPRQQKNQSLWKSTENEIIKRRHWRTWPCWYSISSCIIYSLWIQELLYAQSCQAILVIDLDGKDIKTLTSVP